MVDDALHGSDAVATSLVLAKAIEQDRRVDLVVCGMASTDGAMSVVPAMLAERLGVPQADASRAELDGRRRHGDDPPRRRRRPRARSRRRCPAVVSVTDQTGEPRYPSFKGIMAAKKKPVET